MRAHPWFLAGHVSWSALERRKVAPPFVPACPAGELDVSNFERYVDEIKKEFPQRMAEDRTTFQEWGAWTA